MLEAKNDAIDMDVYLGPNSDIDHLHMDNQWETSLGVNNEGVL